VTAKERENMGALIVLLVLGAIAATIWVCLGLLLIDWRLNKILKVLEKKNA